MFLVLQPDTDESLLERIRRELEPLGCQLQISRGAEQILIVLAGQFDPGRVHAAAAAWPEVDALPLRSDRYYRHERQRRTVMGSLIVGFGLLAVAALCFPVIAYLFPPEHKLELSGPQAVATVERFLPGSARTLRVHGESVIVIHDQPGHFYAVSAYCTYLQPCQLSWSEDRRQLLCPCHGGVFDVQGNVVDGPTNLPLRRFTVTVGGNTIFVDLRG